MKFNLWLLIFFLLHLKIFAKCVFKKKNVCDFSANGMNVIVMKLRRIQSDSYSRMINDGSCQICVELMCLFQKCIDSKAKWDYVYKWLCLKNFQHNQDMCDEYGLQFANHLYFIMKNSTLNEHEKCAVYLGDLCSPNSIKLQWKVELPKKWSKTKKHYSTTEKRILHITDIHFDPYYEPGSIANCAGQLCCRRESSVFNDNETDRRAGYWGELWGTDSKRGVCGSTLQTIEKTFEYISRTQKIDFILWTGDNTRHLPISSTELIVQTTQTITDLFKKYFKNAVIYPSLGNHEGLPNSMCAFVNVGDLPTFKLYSAFENMWRNWITSNGKHSSGNFLKGGFYSTVINNIKIISLNTNLGVRRNWWNLYDPIDPVRQLNWLKLELLECEQHNQRALIIGHHAPYWGEFVSSWVENYLSIMNRFHKIIIGTFYGHKHSEEFRVYYSDDYKPIVFSLLGASIVTYNPSYRVYTLDTSGKITDAETFFANLTDLNRRGRTAKVEYRKLYSMKDVYNIHSVSAEQLHTVYEKLKNNDSLVQLYFRNTVLLSDNWNKTCNSRCKQSLLKNIQVKQRLLQKSSAMKTKFSLFTPFISIFIHYIVNLCKNLT